MMAGTWRDRFRRWFDTARLRKYFYRFLLFVIVSGYIICIAVPVFVHTPVLEDDIKHWPFFHYPIFHTDWYADPLPGLEIWKDRLNFRGGEIWEVWAIANSLFTTLLIQFKAVRRGIIWMSLFSMGCSVLALAALGFHNLSDNHVLWYGFFLIVALLCFMTCDWQMWDNGDLETEEFKAIWWFVDVPTVVGLILFFLYIWKWTKTDFLDRKSLIGADFISGAIAFQLIVSNVLLLIIKAGIHGRLPRSGKKNSLKTATAPAAEVSHGSES